MTPEMKAKADQEADTAVYLRYPTRVVNDVECYKRFPFVEGFLAGAEWQAANPPVVGEDANRVKADSRERVFMQQPNPVDSFRAKCKNGTLNPDELCDVAEICYQFCYSVMAEQLAAKDAEIEQLKKVIKYMDEEVDGWKGLATEGE